MDANRNSIVVLPLQNIRFKLKGFLPFGALNRDLKIIFVSNFLTALGDGFVVYLLPLFMTNNLHASAENVGLLYSFSTLAAALTMIPGGFLADRYDRKKIMLLNWVLWVPIPLTFFFAGDWTQLLIPMFIYGITLSGSAGSAYILGRSQSGKMASAFTTLGSAFALGYVFSSLTAGVMSTFVDTRTIFLLTAALYSAAGLVLTRISRQHPREIQPTTSVAETEKASKPISGYGRLAVLCLLFTLMMFGSALISVYISLFQSNVYQYSDFTILTLGAVYYLGAFFMSFAVGKIGDRYGNASSILFSMVLTAGALSLFIYSGDVLVQAAAAFLRGASFPMWMYMGLMAGQIAPATQKARWISVVQWSTRVGTVPAAFVGGLLFEFSFQLPFLVAIGVALGLAVVVNFRFFKGVSPRQSVEN